ncbi:MAG: lysophospholipase [Clostridia bacterium]|nr:lysophospholipase [Clostridia bacterium]
MMRQFSFLSSDQRTHLAAYRLDPVGTPRAMVQISHGMCEYFGRYEGFAEYLAEHGFLVFGHDHLGHGNSAEKESDLGFTRSGGGAEALVEDVFFLSQRMKKENPELPLLLFGHSMGSFIAREVLVRRGEFYHAAVICGTGGPDTPAAAGKLLASLIMKLKGERHRSNLLKGIAFAGYNKRFEKPCDPNAWLTRDPHVVERYNADPFCTYVFTTRAYHDLFTLVDWVSKKEHARMLPKTLPLLVVSGEEDPVGAWGNGVRKVYERLRDAEMTDVTLKLYPEMRHEILNEIEKEQVWSDLLQWMEQKLASST